MDNAVIGARIRKLRQELNFTQKNLAERLNISDKTVSKWERGLGCPDVSLLPELARVLAVDIEKLLTGTLNANEISGGNMKKLKFYVCPQCGNLLTALADADISCCGKKLQALEPQKADAEHALSIEPVETEYYITAVHPMTKEHYISFVALLTGDRLTLCRQYPEWDMQLRLPRRGHGILLWYCTEHGLFRQII